MQNRYRSRLGIRSQNAEKAALRGLCAPDARPTWRGLVARLCEELAVPLRERNTLLLSVGYSPSFGAAGLDGPEFEAVRRVMALTLERQKPYPGFVIDRQADQLSFISATTNFGSPVDVNLEELALELLHPANASTANAHDFAHTNPRCRRVGCRTTSRLSDSHPLSRPGSSAMGLIGHWRR